MKWIDPIWSNPVGWCESVAKTKLRVFICATYNFVFILFIMLILMIDDIRDGGTVAALGIAICVFVAFIYTSFIASGLYAMHRLLLIIREQEKEIENGE